MRPLRRRSAEQPFRRPWLRCAVTPLTVGELECVVDVVRVQQGLQDGETQLERRTGLVGAGRLPTVGPVRPGAPGQTCSGARRLTSRWSCTVHGLELNEVLPHATKICHATSFFIFGNGMINDDIRT